MCITCLCDRMCGLAIISVDLRILFVSLLGMLVLVSACVLSNVNDEMFIHAPLVRSFVCRFVRVVFGSCHLSPVVHGVGCVPL